MGSDDVWAAILAIIYDEHLLALLFSKTILKCCVGTLTKGSRFGPTPTYYISIEPGKAALSVVSVQKTLKLIDLKLSLTN